MAGAGRIGRRPSRCRQRVWRASSTPTCRAYRRFTTWAPQPAAGVPGAQPGRGRNVTVIEANPQLQRIAACVAAYDGQGWHRTGTAVDGTYASASGGRATLKSDTKFLELGGRSRLELVAPA